MADVPTSILTSVKKSLGLDEDYDAFDADIVFAINTAFFTLWQLGIGNNTSAPFKIEDDSEEWPEFIDDGRLEMCKTYVTLRTKLLFDPPASSYLVDAIKEEIREYEFRMTVGSESYTIAEGGTV